MATVTISGTDYEAYADLEMADEYLGASISSAAVAWTAASEDTKGRALVEGYRLINRQAWQGDKLSAEQDAAWPRSGVSDVDDYELPQAVIHANVELAAAFVEGSLDVLTNSTTDSNTRRLKAGSVEIEFFRATSNAARFPLIIQELLGPLLLGEGASYAAPTATGVDGCSSFATGYGVNRNI